MSEVKHALTDMEIGALVTVSQAHGIRTQARKAARLLKKASDASATALKAAQSDARLFGNCGDCGEEYTGEFRRANAEAEAVQPLFDEAVQAEIAAEQYYKRVKHHVLSLCPGLAPHIERLLTASNVPESDVSAQSRA